MRFILRGKPYNLTKEDVERRMRGVSPEVIRKHYVVINGKKYPPKQVLNILLGIDRLDFTAMDARNILRRLGFELGRIE